MGVTIGKININAVKIFSYMVKPALYESKALEIFKLLNLKSRKNTQLKLMLNIVFYKLLLFKFKVLRMHIEDKYEYKSDNRRMIQQKIKVTLNHP